MGRYCLPVKAESRASVPGIVHDRSGSGNAVFVEPQAVVELNNRLRELAADEKEARHGSSAECCPLTSEAPPTICKREF